jgi:hypothetical protein
MEAPYLAELEADRSAISFRNARIEAEYREHVARRSELNVRRQLALGAVMLFGVTFIDFLLGPLEFAREAAWLRLLFMMPPIIAALGLTCYKRALWARQLAGIAVGVSVCATSTAIAAMATTLDQPTVAGSYFIVIVFGYFFLGLRYQLAAIMATVLVLAYIPIALLSGAQDAGAVHNGYYLLVMNIICAAGARQLELARRVSVDSFYYS